MDHPKIGRMKSLGIPVKSTGELLEIRAHGNRCRDSQCGKSYPRQPPPAEHKERGISRAPQDPDRANTGRDSADDGLRPLAEVHDRPAAGVRAATVAVRL